MVDFGKFPLLTLDFGDEFSNLPPRCSPAVVLFIGDPRTPAAADLDPCPNVDALGHFLRPRTLPKCPHPRPHPRLKCECVNVSFRFFSPPEPSLIGLITNPHPHPKRERVEVSLRLSRRRHDPSTRSLTLVPSAKCTYFLSFFLSLTSSAVADTLPRPIREAGDDTRRRLPRSSPPPKCECVGIFELPTPSPARDVSRRGIRSAPLRCDDASPPSPLPHPKREAGTPLRASTLPRFKCKVEVPLVHRRDRDRGRD
jgi:hypothetical protein